MYMNTTTTTKIHSQSGLDKKLTALAVSSFIGTSFEPLRSDGDVRRDCLRLAFDRAEALTATPEQAADLFNRAIAWAEKFTA
jgi:hypothetical protein